MNGSCPDDKTAIHTCGLSKVYDNVPVVRNINLTVPYGQTFGFLGPNGAGKSTVIAMLCTLTAPTHGHATVGGADILTRPADVRRRIGLVFQEHTVDPELTARENLLLHATLYGVPRHQRKPHVTAMLELIGLAERADDFVRTFSGGMRRRLELARGMLHHPQVLFLDEPTLGLDPHSRRQVWNHLRLLRERHGMTVFLTTHYLDEAENCDRIAIIDHGSVVADDTPHALKSAIATDRIELHTDNDRLAQAALRERFGLDATSSPTDDGLTVTMPDGPSQVPRLCAGLGVPVRSVSITRPTLDDVFLHHTGHPLQPDQGNTA